MGIKTLLAGMDRSRFNPFLGLPIHEDYRNNFRGLNIKVLHSEFVNKFDIAGLSRLVSLIKRWQIDIIHSHVQITDLMVALAGKIFPSVKTVTTIHAPINIDGNLQLERTFRAHTYKWVLRHGFNRIITVSRALRQEVIQKARINPAKVMHIVNGVDPSPLAQVGRERARSLLSIEDHRRVVVQVAWFGLRKGHGILLDRASTIVKHVPEVLFLLVGDGRLKESCEVMVDQLGLGKYFRFLGYREDVPRLLAASDLAVLPSFSEGLPRSLLEAMGTGLPVVASGLDGIAELVVHGVTGLLVRPGSPAEFAEAVVRLLKDPELSREMGLQGKQRVEKHFHQAKMVSATERLYEQLMAD